MSMALMYTSIKPSPGPVHPSCPIQCSLDESKGPGAGLPAQRCSLSMCRQWKALQPFLTGRTRCRCPRHIPESCSAPARLQQPSSCPCTLVEGHPNLHPGPQQAARDQGAAGAGAPVEQPGCLHPSASSCWVPVRAASSGEHGSRLAVCPSPSSPTAQACTDVVCVSLQDAGPSARAGRSRG